MFNHRFTKVLTLFVLFSMMSVFVVGCGGDQASQEGTADTIDSWVLATNHEFSVRPDGYPELQQVYDFKFDDVQVMDLGVTYGALQNGKVPVAMGLLLMVELLRLVWLILRMIRLLPRLQSRPSGETGSAGRVS